MKLELNLHSPLTERQKRVLRSRKEHLLIQGPAGTAKTYTALARGLMKLSAGEVDQIIVIRSPVEVRKIGHLPGDADEKMDPYSAPYVGVLSEISPKANYRTLVSKKLIEFIPTTFLRGRTFHNKFVIADEYQNLSAHELDTIITRVGQGTQLCIVGDPNGQSDLTAREREESRDEVQDIMNALMNMSSVEVVKFLVSDIVRSAFLKEYYEARELTEPMGLPVGLFGVPNQDELAA